MISMPEGRTAPASLAILALVACCSALFAKRSEIVEGNPASPVRVVIYEDLQCSDCERFRSLLDEKILPRYGSRVAFVHRDFPLGKHEWARQAAVAARWVYAQDPDLGITFRRELMAEHDHITPANLRGWLQEFAARNHLDEKGILDSITAPQLVAMVDQDYQGGVARGVAQTPTVYVGGQKLVETILYDDFARALDIELGR
jgi:protein-disulfide isomerase